MKLGALLMPVMKKISTMMVVVKLQFVKEKSESSG